jgi:(p)ppGpp synthase/HD superfamily hydrolase
MSALDTLKNLVLAPYIMKAMALIRVQRLVGGNQFRHCFMVLGILLDYKLFYDSVLLKAALLHDLFEDIPETGIDEVRCIDSDGHSVVDLVLEVTRQPGETKIDYLRRVLESGSRNALILKCADRISNLTDLHRDTHTDQSISEYLDQTEKYVIPMARKVNEHMVTELIDLVARRRKIISLLEDTSED